MLPLYVGLLRICRSIASLNMLWYALTVALVPIQPLPPAGLYIILHYWRVIELNRIDTVCIQRAGSISMHRITNKDVVA